MNTNGYLPQSRKADTYGNLSFECGNIELKISPMALPSDGQAVGRDIQNSETGVPSLSCLKKKGILPEKTGTKILPHRRQTFIS
jgi:hypothetical protein